LGYTPRRAAKRLSLDLQPAAKTGAALFLSEVRAAKPTNQKGAKPEISLPAFTDFRRFKR
jgi:hypothetical protein